MQAGDHGEAHRLESRVRADEDPAARRRYCL